MLEQGGPGVCYFAINNACNARCGFCNFSLDRLPREHWKFVDRDGALEAVDILQRNGIRYLIIFGGEPTLHPHLPAIIRKAQRSGLTVLLITHGAHLKPDKVHELADAGVSQFIISIDAATVEAHESNRGLPGVCERIRAANRIIRERGLDSAASVTMSRLVDYEALPDFLIKLGFDSVSFSYPITHLGSNFLGFSDSKLVDYTRDELLAAFERVKRVKRRIRVANPTEGIEEVERFVRGEPQRYECLGGYNYFHLDWNLNVWRCHYWHEPMCSIYEFDEAERIRDGCTRCMIDCYRDSSVMQHVATSAHDAYAAVRAGKLREGARALMRWTNLGSLRAVLEEVPYLTTALLQRWRPRAEDRGPAAARDQAPSRAGRMGRGAESGAEGSSTGSSRPSP